MAPAIVLNNCTIATLNNIHGQGQMTLETAVAGNTDALPKPNRPRRNRAQARRGARKGKAKRKNKGKGKGKAIGVFKPGRPARRPTLPHLRRRRFDPMTDLSDITPVPSSSNDPGLTSSSGSDDSGTPIGTPIGAAHPGLFLPDNMGSTPGPSVF